MATTAADILELFSTTGTDITFGSGGGETPTERAQRIAEEVNSGWRTLDQVSESLNWIRNQGGTTLAMTPEGGWDTISLIYGWLPEEALQVFLDAYVESGNADAGWAEVHKDPRYEQWFPGNMTEDGRPRLEEKDYAAAVASYDEVFINVGINPDTMRERYGELIRGDVSPAELEQNRINPMYDRIVSQSQALKSWYAENYSIDLTDAALLASAINPELGERILTKQISMGEIGGEAREAGYNIDFDLVERIVEETELTKAQAERSFLDAKSTIPIMNVLAARHADPDDDFDVNEFIAADMFKDPVQMRRMSRLMAQERSTFSGGGLGYGAAQSRVTGGLTGLTER